MTVRDFPAEKRRRGRDPAPTCHPVEGRHAGDGRLRAFPPSAGGSWRHNTLPAQEQPGTAVPFVLTLGPLSCSGSLRVYGLVFFGERCRCAPQSRRPMPNQPPARTATSTASPRCPALGVEMRRMSANGWSESARARMSAAPEPMAPKAARLRSNGEFRAAADRTGLDHEILHPRPFGSETRSSATSPARASRYS